MRGNRIFQYLSLVLGPSTGALGEKNTKETISTHQNPSAILENITKWIVLPGMHGNGGLHGICSPIS